MSNRPEYSKMHPRDPERAVKRSEYFLRRLQKTQAGERNDPRAIGGGGNSYAPQRNAHTEGEPQQ